MNKMKQRFRHIYISLTVLCTLFAGFLVYESGMIKGLSAEVDHAVERDRFNQKKKDVVEGRFLDRYGDDGRTVISNCDNYIYMGGNDVETAHNVARRADLPEIRVLNMPVGMNILFRRGENPAISYNFNLEQFLDKIREGEKNYDSCIC